MSVAEPSSTVDERGVTLTACGMDIVEIAALRARTSALRTIAAAHEVALAAFGKIAIGNDHLVVCVRPERWLLLKAQETPGATAQLWQSACAGSAVVIDLSSGLAALYLSGPGVRDMLAKGCRLDLAPEKFPSGTAAATTVAQVSVVLLALSSGMLLLTPATTARHVHEWLEHAVHPQPLRRQPALSFSSFCGAAAS